MGILGHSHDAQLQVTLNDPNGEGSLWPPTSELTGQVQLFNCGPNDHRNDLAVVFWGMSQTDWKERHGDRRDHLRSHCPILSIPQPVSAPVLMPDGTTLWNFTLRIPENCSLAWGMPPWPGADKHYWTRGLKESDIYDVAEDMEIVPSMQIDGHSVLYRVAALLHDAKGKQMYADTVINITQGPDAGHPDPVTAADRLVIKSALLAAENQGHRDKLSFGEKASAMFHSSNLPHFTFSWSAMAPTQVMIGEPLRLTLACTPDPGPADAPEPDMVVVESVEVEVRRLLWYRAPGFLGSEKHHDDFRSVFSQKLVGRVAPLSRHNDWSVIAQTNTLDLPFPDLSCANIRVDYDLEVKWNIRCADVSETLKVYVRHVNVYAQVGIEPPNGPQMPPIQ